VNIPRIAITAGEPAGIGPDILIQAAQREFNAELIALADPALLADRAATLGLPLSLQHFEPSATAQPHQPGTLKLQAVPLTSSCTPGQLDPNNAQYVLDTLSTAVGSCQSGDVQAMVTAPVQKSVINDAGVPFSGHTEFLAAATATPRVVMMLVARQLRVALATTHLPLSQVPAAITATLLSETLHILYHDLRTKFGIDKPRIAVLGLNPHAGESGHLGTEELTVISPTLDNLRRQGLNLQGPLPADTAFNPKVLEACDAVFAMYHDQGLPVLKYAGFGEAVNVTLGLPIVRTSVDHGTALDLAGSGKADDSSLQQAILLAIEMASR